MRRDRDIDNQRLQANLQRQMDKDAATVAYWNRKADQGDLKLANDAELMALRDKWMGSKDKNDARRLDLVEKEMELRTKRNDARIASNEKIAGLRTGSAERIAQLRNDAAMLRTQYQEAKKDGRAEDANKIRLKLKGILDEVDAFQGATGEAIIP